jgi:hypothetical protein
VNISDMPTSGILLQVITSQPKAYERLFDYIKKHSGTFSRTSPGTIEHVRKARNPGEYGAAIHFEKTSTEVLLARMTDRKPGMVGAFIGLCIRCFGDDLISVNLQTISY